MNPNNASPISVPNPLKKRMLLRNNTRSSEHQNISFSSAYTYSSDTRGGETDLVESNNISQKRKRSFNVTNKFHCNTVEGKIVNRKDIDGDKNRNYTTVQTTGIPKKTIISQSNKVESSSEDSDSDIILVMIVTIVSKGLFVLIIQRSQAI